MRLVLSGACPALAHLLGAVSCRSSNTTPVIRRVIYTTNTPRVDQYPLLQSGQSARPLPRNETAAIKCLYLEGALA